MLWTMTDSRILDVCQLDARQFCGVPYPIFVALLLGGWLQTQEAIELDCRVSVVLSPVFHGY